MISGSMSSDSYADDDDLKDIWPTDQFIEVNEDGIMNVGDYNLIHDAEEFKKWQEIHCLRNYEVKKFPVLISRYEGDENISFLPLYENELRQMLGILKIAAIVRLEKP